MSTRHELVASAAVYEAAKAYERHCDRNGRPASHAEAKDLLASLAGAASDGLFETHGLKFLDKDKTRHEARIQVLERVSEDNY
ncbi:hypothetical protein MNV49_007635 [Pseudohyphozyma bogoriensis]|nr:hypothetical protein MNV49_007635 [Pseudohyphozyma bogoriensis]